MLTQHNVWHDNQTVRPMILEQDRLTAAIMKRFPAVLPLEMAVVQFQAPAPRIMKAPS